ncbi:hypothetical protein L195_g063399, partial [Trifolium pratense]
MATIKNFLTHLFISLVSPLSFLHP